MTTDVTLRHKDVTLLEILDRVLDKGVVVAGDLTISVADVDLIYLGIRVLLCSVETMEHLRRPEATRSATEVHEAILSAAGIASGEGP
ncbi:MAG: gas vesicle protein [Anaerolineales bacterium]|nr:gas vesicle protein [Anaerolineales bacterium]